MSDNGFLVAIKSTLDKVLFDFATTLGSPPPKVYDLDDPTALDTLLESEEPAVVWEFLQRRRLDPFGATNEIMFSVGVKEAVDPSNYNILTLAGRLEDALASLSVAVRDYSGATAGPDQGRLLITDVTVDPQLMDRSSSFRMVSVSGRALRLG